MSRTPYYTSDDLISAIKRKISFPISSNTFSEDDILKFASEEMMISQVPSVLQYHEEYYVDFEILPVLINKSRYPIPSRAIGMKLRDVFWSDDAIIAGQPYGNLFEMSRILPDDKAFFQRSIGANQQLAKFYIENDNVVIVPPITGTTTGSIVLFYYLRPNQLVLNERASQVTGFIKNITIANASIVAGNEFFINDTIFQAVTSGATGNQFVIGGTSIITAGNLATAITNSGLATATNSGTAIVSITYTDFTYVFDKQSSGGIVIDDQTSITLDSVVSNLTNGSIVDFIQRNGGHKILNFDVTIPAAGVSSGLIMFDDSDIPETLVIGDYICSQYETIIPQIPDDLHTALAERTCARILAALGDTQGLQMSEAKIADIEKQQGRMVDDRVEGSPKKISARHSLLRRGGMHSRRNI